MIVLKKFTTLILCVFDILPIDEARFYHGYNSYRQYYGNEVKYSALDKIFKQTNYDHNEIQKKVNHFKGDNNYVDFESNFMFLYDNELKMRSDINNNAASAEDPTPCEGNNFCEDDPDYPQTYVDEILDKNPMLKFHVVSKQEVEFDSHGNSDSFCRSTLLSVCPRKAKAINDKWMWIIQSTQQQLIQCISYVSCEDEAEGCRYVSKSEDFYPTCKQMYRNFSLLAFKSNERRMAVFSFPFYCCCNL